MVGVVTLAASPPRSDSTVHAPQLVLPDSYDSIIAEAQASECPGNWSAARAAYQRLLDDPTLPASCRFRPKGGGRGAHTRRKAPDVAVSLMQQAVRAAADAGNAEAEARALNGLAVIEQTLGNLTDPKRSTPGSHSRGSRWRRHAACHNRPEPRDDCEHPRQPELALRSYESSRNRFKALGMSSFEAHVLNNIGMVCTDSATGTRPRARTVPRAKYALAARRPACFGESR